MDRPDYPEVCAYVDGELDAAAASRVAYAAARDPDIAAQIAQLTKLKSVLAGMPGEAAPADWARPRPHRSARRWGAGLVAGAMFAALLSGVLVAERIIRTPAAPTFADLGLAAHRAWSESVSGPAGTATIHSVALSRSAFTAPDLTAARLTLQTAEALGRGTHGILHFGYVGTRGCRLSLFVQLNAEATAAESVRGAGLRTSAWHEEGIGYLAVADAMDEAHFRTIVAALKQYSREPAPFSAPTETLLAESRQHAKPCTA